MSTTPLASRSKRSEESKIIRWRSEQLIAAGFDAEAALLIAKALEVDLHRALELRRAGCEPSTALRILL